MMRLLPAQFRLTSGVFEPQPWRREHCQGTGRVTENATFLSRPMDSSETNFKQSFPYVTYSYSTWGKHMLHSQSYVFDNGSSRMVIRCILLNIEASDQKSGCGTSLTAEKIGKFQSQDNFEIHPSFFSPVSERWSHCAQQGSFTAEHTQNCWLREKEISQYLMRLI